MEGNRNSTLMNNSSRELSREFKSVRKSQANVMKSGISGERKADVKIQKSLVKLD